MINKKFRIILVVFGVFLLLFLVVNFGFNFWLKRNLPSYIKNNSEYLVTYKTLDVELQTGNIFATAFTIKTQNAAQTDHLGLQGTIDTLTIGRLGIFDLIFHQNISTAHLNLRNPNINVILPKSNKKKTKNKKNTFDLENLTISKGNIQIFRATKQKILSVKDLNLKVKKLRLNEDSISNKFPVLFDEYHLNAKNFYFRPDNVYAFTAKLITTKDGELSVKDFAMIPLLNYQQFVRFFPKKRNLFQVNAAEMSFKNIVFKGKKLSLEKVRFESPQIKLFTTDVKPKDKKKSFTYDVNLENIFLDNAKIEIIKPNGNPLFLVENLTMKLARLVMNEETAKGNIPFKYDHFNIKGKNINYFSANEKVKVSSLALLPKSADLRNISVKPMGNKQNKTSLDLTAQSIFLKINIWEFLNNKLKLNVENVVINQLNGTIKTTTNSAKKKPTFEGIQFPLLIKNADLKNSNVVIDIKNQPLILKDVNANLQNVEVNEKTILESIPFKTGNFTLTTRNFDYKTKFYNYSASILKLNKNAVEVSKFAMKPRVSRAEFIKMIPTEKDMYDLRVNHLTANGKWDLVSAKKFLDIENVTLKKVDALIFRSKIPKDDLTEKKLYSKLLRSIKIPLFVKNLDITNSLLVYEEDTKKSDGPGILTFNNFNLNAQNINSGKFKHRPTAIPITIKCHFMNASPMNIKWSLDTASSIDNFAISGNVMDLPASRINPFTEPYLKIRATGEISELIFSFKGNRNGLDGSLKMKHKDLKVSVLKKTGEKDEILSVIANVFVRTDSGKYPESVEVENVERDKTKSFFNLLWRGIEQGLKKTLIGKNAPKVEESIKGTVDNTKSLLDKNKKDLRKMKNTVKMKVQKAANEIQK